MDHIDQLIQFFWCGLTADGDAERPVNDVGGNSHRLQNMASMTLGAGTACGNTDAVILQDVNGVLGGQTCNGQRQNVGGVM